MQKSSKNAMPAALALSVNPAYNMLRQERKVRLDKAIEQALGESADYAKLMQKTQMARLMKAAAAVLESESDGAYGRIYISSLTGCSRKLERNAIIQLFGSEDKALRAAGLHPIYPTHDELLEIVMCFVRQNGRVPGKTDANNGLLLYSGYTFAKRCDGVTGAVRELGLAPLTRGASASLKHREALKTARPVMWRCQSTYDL